MNDHNVARNEKKMYPVTICYYAQLRWIDMDLHSENSGDRTWVICENFHNCS